MVELLDYLTWNMENTIYVFKSEDEYRKNAESLPVDSKSLIYLSGSNKVIFKRPYTIIAKIDTDGGASYGDVYPLACPCNTVSNFGKCFNDVYIDGEKADKGSFIYQDECKNPFIHLSGNKHELRYVLTDEYGRLLSFDDVPTRFISNNPFIVSIEIGKSIEKIGDSAFANLENLKEVNLGRVSEIADFAFSNAKSLKKVMFPAETKVMHNSFFGCSSLESITIPCYLPPVICGNPFYGMNENLTVYVPKHAMRLYKQDDEWGKYADMLKPIKS